MTGPAATVPKNIFYFEVLLYLSLLIDVLSAAFLDRMPDDVTAATKMLVNFIAIGMTFVFIQLVWLAAYERKSWARNLLVAAFALSVVSIAGSVGESGMQFSAFVDVISTALTAFGLYFSFTGDARDWFRQPP